MYPPDRVWNCDEMSMQAGTNGGGIVSARRGSHRVHLIVPNQREWLSVLLCMNAARLAIPSFYVFKGMRFCQNYIERCDPGANMSMQPRTWMTSYLFSAWISHFIESVRRMDGISTDQWHLLILDGHASHIGLEVVQEARNVRLDLLTLPSHTSHTMQPLDVSVFKPFKTFFKEYTNFWTFGNLNQPATKQTLAHWVSLALRRALTPHNIKKNFSFAAFCPLTITPCLAISGPVQPTNSKLTSRTTTDTTSKTSTKHTPAGLDRRCYLGFEGVDIATELDQVPDMSVSHFFVDADTCDPPIAREAVGLDPTVSTPESITRFLTFPTITARAPRRRFIDPVVDFTKSVMLTSVIYVSAVKQLQEKEEAARTKATNKNEREETKRRKLLEREEERR